MMMTMNFATNLLGFSREQYVAGSILFVSYESSLFLREDTVKKEEEEGEEILSIVNQFLKCGSINVKCRM